MWRSIRVKFVVVYLLLILFSMELIGAYFVRTLTTSLIRNETTAAESQTQLLATLAAPQMAALEKHSSEAVERVLSSFPQVLSGTVYLLNQDGVVEDTSANTALIGQKRIDSIATQALLSQRTVFGIRLDLFSNEHTLSVAVPMLQAHTFVGLVEYVVSIQTTYNTIHEVTTIFYTGSASVLILSLFLGYILTRTITKPVLDVTRQARMMASGNFKERVDVGSNDEYGDLAMAINDLTEKLEDALGISSREQDRLRAIITSMGEGVIVFNAELKPILMNHTARKLLPPMEECLPTLAEYLEISSIITSQTYINQIFVKELGVTLLHIHVTAVQRADKIDGYVAVLHDVTEQEKLNQSRRDFVANVSHELRTPLTSIKSYLEAVAELQDDDETRKKFLGVVEQETDRMVRLTRDLLQLSGLDTERVTYEERRIAVDEWIAAAVQRFALQAEKQGILLLYLRTPSASVLGDRDMLDRVLDNLLSNAMKYTLTGGRIEVRGQVRPGQVSVFIQDTGIGIPEEDIGHVFERFFRVDKGRSRRLGGVGLGLALVREITERHGGRIRIDSQPEVGTTVRLDLPTVSVDKPSAPEKEELE